MTVCHWHEHSHAKDLDASSPQEWQSLPSLRFSEEQSLPWAECSLIVCAENVCSSFLSPDIYSLKTAPLQRELLPRCARPACCYYNTCILVQLYRLAILSFKIVYNKHTKLLGFGSFSFWEPSLSNPRIFCLCVRHLFIPFPPQLSQGFGIYYSQ